MNIAALTRLVLRHKGLVVAFWLLVTIAGFAGVGSAAGALSKSFTGTHGEGIATGQTILRTYGNGGLTPPLVPVVTLPSHTTVDSPGVRVQLDAAFAKIAAAAPDVRVVSFASTGNRVFVSRDGRTAFGLVYLPSNGDIDSSPALLPVRNAIAAASVAGAHFQLTGVSELESAGNGGSSGPSVLVETLIGGLGALVVLAWVFGSFLALVPLLIATVAIVTTFLLIWGVTTITDISFIVEFLVSLVGLGIAIDYSLLIVTRWREERAAGLDNEAAIQRAMATAGHAVIFSGTTVAIGLCALIVLPVATLRSIGYGGMLIPLVSVAATVTLLPVILATVGLRLDWPRPRRGDQHSRAWAAWTRFVVARRWLAAAAGLTVLGLLIGAAFTLQLGDPRATAPATTGQAHDGLVALERAGIPPGALTPFEVLVQGADPGAAASSLAHVSGVHGAVAPEGAAWRRGGSAIVAVVPTADGNTAAGRQTLTRVRSAAHALPGRARVGGDAAQTADFISSVYGNFPLMVALIALVTFVLLVRAFRSLVLPLKAILLNGLSVAAAYGVMVLVWQDGHGAHLIWGAAPTGSITTWVPFLTFAFLFGLSMDYEVFILARMREEHDAGHSTDGAVVRGLSVTGRLVTSAALILFLAFTSLASTPNLDVKIIATGLAAGILLDATVIRALMVPALVSLMGRWNWWLPSWLDRFAPARSGTAPRHAPGAGRRAATVDEQPL